MTTEFDFEHPQDDTFVGPVVSSDAANRIIDGLRQTNPPSDNRLRSDGSVNHDISEEHGLVVPDSYTLGNGVEVQFGDGGVVVYRDSSRANKINDQDISASGEKGIHYLEFSDLEIDVNNLVSSGLSNIDFRFWRLISEKKDLIQEPDYAKPRVISESLAELVASVGSETDDTEYDADREERVAVTEVPLIPFDENRNNIDKGEEWIEQLQAEEMEPQRVELGGLEIVVPPGELLKKRAVDVLKHVESARDLTDLHIRTTQVFTETDRLLGIVRPAEVVLKRSNERLVPEKRIESLLTCRDVTGEKLIDRLIRSDHYRGDEVGLQLLKKILQQREDFREIPIHGIDNRVIDRIVTSAQVSVDEKRKNMGIFKHVDPKKPLSRSIELNSQESWRIIMKAFYDEAVEIVAETHREIYASYSIPTPENRFGINLVGDLDDYAKARGWRIGRDYQVRGRGGDESGKLFLPLYDAQTIIDQLIESAGGERSNAIVNLGVDGLSFMMLDRPSTDASQVSKEHDGGYLLIAYDPLVPPYERKTFDSTGQTEMTLETDVVFMLDSRPEDKALAAEYCLKVVHLTDKGYNILRDEIERLKAYVETEGGRFTNPMPRLRKIHEKNIIEGQKIAKRVDRLELVRAALNRVIDDQRQAATDGDEGNDSTAKLLETLDNADDAELLSELLGNFDSKRSLPSASD